jgi:putative transposase
MIFSCKPLSFQRCEGGQYFYWYMVLDIYSRKIVGHEVHLAESAELAGLLMRKASLAEGLAGRKVVLQIPDELPARTI